MGEIPNRLYVGYLTHFIRRYSSCSWLASVVFLAKLKKRLKLVPFWNPYLLVWILFKWRAVAAIRVMIPRMPARTTMPERLPFADITIASSVRNNACWAPATTGVAGAAGSVTTCYYEAAATSTGTASGATSTGAGVAAMIAGVKGAAGSTGAGAATGVAGAIGAAGSTGATGATGAGVTTGVAGATGVAGVMGVAGVTGAAAGVTGTAGVA
jgi:hypothetical protein